MSHLPKKSSASVSSSYSSTSNSCPGASWMTNYSKQTVLGTFTRQCLYWTDGLRRPYNDISGYLINFIPAWIQVLFDGLRFELLVSDPQHSIWIRLALHQSHHVRVFGYKIPRLQNMDPYYTLKTSATMFTRWWNSRNQCKQWASKLENNLVLHER